MKTPIDVDRLELEISKAKPSLTCHQVRRAKQCISDLRTGTSAFQKAPLPPVFVKNVPSALKYGEHMTDAIVTWLKEDFAAGPFSEPPLSNFRVNPLMGLEQNGKVRPILNVSELAGRSFNDNVCDLRLEKVYMSSALDFSQGLLKAGKNAIFSKFDLQNAYKNVPAKNEDLHLQGFSWLGKFFFEKKQIFCAKTAVSNFDIFGHTILDIVLSHCNIPRSLVFRRLDDVPVVGPSKSKHCEIFSEKYKDFCTSINVKLAKDCPDNNKAFINQTFGRVLGIDFDSKDLSWAIPTEKKSKCLSCINHFMKSSHISLLDMQKLMGRLADVGQLCPFLRGFKRPLNQLLGNLQRHPEERLVIPRAAKDDLWVWAGMLSLSERLPILLVSDAPKLSFLEFTSDAAGRSEDRSYKPGVGGIGFDETGEIILAFQHIWDDLMINTLKDNKGTDIGSKSTTLEMVGLVIPLLLVPEKLVNSHVVFKVDNLGCFFAWENKFVKNDMLASILLKTSLLITSYLGTTVFVRHLPRLLSWEGRLVDRLSRSSTSTRHDMNLVRSFSHLSLPLRLDRWLANPQEDWNLPYELLSHVKSRVIFGQ